MGMTPGLPQLLARLRAGDYAQAIAEFRRAAAGDPLVADPSASGNAVAEAGAALRRMQLPVALKDLVEGVTLMFSE